jgi:hypothetical protein
MDVSAIATVQTVVGNVVAVNGDGMIRVLKTGDALFQGELLKTDLGASATVTHTHGLTQTIGENTSLTLTQSVDGISHFADDKSFLPSGTASGTLFLNPASGEGEHSNALFNFHETSVDQIVHASTPAIGDGQTELQTLSYNSLLSTGESMVSLALSAISGSTNNDAAQNLNAANSNSTSHQTAFQDVNALDSATAPDAATSDVISQLLTTHHPIL